MSKIVIGYDGSTEAKHALERAADFANGDPVIVVGAVHPFVTRGGRGFDPIEADAQERNLSEAKARLTELGIEARTIEAVGDPAQVIADEAEAQEADLIVVGSHGRNFLERLLNPSVSAGVSRRAKTDVLVVH